MIREYVIEYAEDRIGIGMIENRRKGGGDGVGKVRGKFGVMWAWKVRGCGRGKCVESLRGEKTRGCGLECSMGRALKVRGFLWVCKLGSFLGRDNE